MTYKLIKYFGHVIKSYLSKTKRSKKWMQSQRNMNANTKLRIFKAWGTQLRNETYFGSQSRLSI
jgi:hypothetical protein